jgi:hypothetical protein
VSGKLSEMPETENDFPTYRMIGVTRGRVWFRRSDCLESSGAQSITDICHQVKDRQSGNFFEVYTGSN